jgi:hypothetical protein
MRTSGDYFCEGNRGGESSRVVAFGPHSTDSRGGSPQDPPSTPDGPAFWERPVLRSRLGCPADKIEVERMCSEKLQKVGGKYIGLTRRSMDTRRAKRLAAPRSPRALLPGPLPLLVKPRRSDWPARRGYSGPSPQPATGAPPSGAAGFRAHDGWLVPDAQLAISPHGSRSSLRLFVRVD